MNLQIASQSVSAMREAKMSKKRRAPEFASNRFVRVSTGVILVLFLSLSGNAGVAKLPELCHIPFITCCICYFQIDMDMLLQ
jgi:hypothetical protein